MSVHRLDTDNIGDRLSSPALYFDFLAGAASYDLLRIPGRVSRHARVMVFGGGGLLDNDYFRPAWTDVLAATSAEAIAWGVGHNRHGAQHGRYPDFLRRFALVGVRDSGPDVPAGFEWVPCASCMHREFDRASEIVTDVVCYSHARHPLVIDGVTAMDNTTREPAAVIRFLASAETVLTNTYHGMYWATLLGKKVVVFPFSSKFHAFRYPVTMSTLGDWQAARRRAVACPDALAECRAANRGFAVKVQERLDGMRA